MSSPSCLVFLLHFCIFGRGWGKGVGLVTLHPQPTLSPQPIPTITHTTLTHHSHTTHTPLTHHSHNSHTTLTHRSHTAYITLTQHSHNAHTTLTQRSHKAHTMLAQCSHNLHPTLTQCLAPIQACVQYMAGRLPSK